MSTLTVKELSAPTGEVIKIAAGKTLDLKSQGTTTLPSGSVLQVVTISYSPTNIFTTSSSFVTTGKSISITPKSTSSKILVTLSGGGQRHTANSTMGNTTVYRGSTNIGHATYGLSSIFAVNNSSGSNVTPHSLSVLDSPNTASSVTYTFYFKGNGSNFQFNYSDRANLTATLTEIAG